VLGGRPTVLTHLGYGLVQNDQLTKLSGKCTADTILKHTDDISYNAHQLRQQHGKVDSLTALSDSHSSTLLASTSATAFNSIGNQV